MTEPQILMNLGLLGLCYLYVIGIILVSSRVKDRLPVNLSRKFLHIMIGNLCFIIPFFSFNTFPLSFPFFVAAPFILLTFLFSPWSPINLSNRLSGLAEITSGGHRFGLVLYSVSYTVLAFFFSAKPYIIAAGIFPMAYGDAAASLVGQKFGRHQYDVFGKKSFEGSLAMFAVTFLGLMISLLFFSYLYTISFVSFLFASLGVAAIATVCEAFTPRGFDNLTVPLLSAAAFLLLIGGI